MSGYQHVCSGPGESCIYTNTHAIRAQLQAERAEAIEHLGDYAPRTPGRRQAEDKVSWLNEKLYKLDADFTAEPDPREETTGYTLQGIEPW